MLGKGILSAGRGLEWLVLRCSEVFLMIYPDDGNALRRLERDGDDLTKPRNIDFAVVFADASSAEQFAEHFRVGP